MLWGCSPLGLNWCWLCSFSLGLGLLVKSSLIDGSRTKHWIVSPILVFISHSWAIVPFSLSIHSYFITTGLHFRRSILYFLYSLIMDWIFHHMIKWVVISIQLLSHWRNLNHFYWTPCGGFYLLYCQLVGQLLDFYRSYFSQFIAMQFSWLYISCLHPNLDYHKWFL